MGEKGINGSKGNKGEQGKTGLTGRNGTMGLPGSPVSVLIRCTCVSKYYMHYCRELMVNLVLQELMVQMVQ